jgi:hypothetical protein
MKKQNLVVLASLCLLSACSTTSQQPVQVEDARECAKNFSYNGSFLAGRTFKTNLAIMGVSKDEGVERAAKWLAKDGWSITSANKDLGIVTASQTVSYGEGKTAPLNVAIDSISGGVDVAISFSISGGTTAPVNAVKDSFCNILSAIAGE